MNTKQKIIISIGMLVFFILLCCHYVFATDQTDFCERLGLNLSLVEDVALCNEYWDMINNNTINNNYYTTENHYHTEESNLSGEFYSKEEVDQLIKEALEEDELDKLKKELAELKTEEEKEPDFLGLLETLMNMSKEETPPPTEEEKITKEDIKDIVALQMKANSESPTSAATVRNREEVISSSQTTKILGVSIWWLVIVALILLAYLWKTGKLKQIIPRETTQQQVNFEEFETEQGENKSRQIIAPAPTPAPAPASKKRRERKKAFF